MTFFNQLPQRIFLWSLSDSKSLQVFQTFFQYFGRSYQCCNLDSLGSSADFQLFQLPYQVFSNRSICTNYNLYPPSHSCSIAFKVLRQGSSTCLCFRFLLFFTLCSTLVWMVSIRPPIFNYTSPLTNYLETVPSTPVTIGITITLIFKSFLVLCQSRPNWHSFLLLWFTLCRPLERQITLKINFLLC